MIALLTNDMLYLLSVYSYIYFCGTPTEQVSSRHRFCYSNYKKSFPHQSLSSPLLKIMKQKNAASHVTWKPEDANTTVP